MQNKPIRQKKCKACGDPFNPWNSMAKVCGPACALEFAQQQSAKNIAKANARRKKEFLESDVKFQKAKAQKAFNEYIRMRDAHLGCVSCDKGPDWQGQWHAGHYKTVGARGDLRFNENNCSKQCSVCNNHLSGNLVAYRDELVRRIGIAAVESLEKDGEPKRYRAEDYAEIARVYSQKSKELKCKDKLR